jgi:hypothetical protein
MELDLDTIEQPKTRWLDCDGVRFLIKYATPKESEKFRKTLRQMGIADTKKGDFEINAGREMAFFEALARQYVLDWDGAIKAANPEDAKYSPERMAKVLANHGGLLRMVTESIGEAEAFFTESGRNGTANSAD